MSRNEITVNGFYDVDCINITDTALVTENQINCDGTQTGTSRGIHSPSVSVQVREIANNRWSSGWDSNQVSVLANNVQYPVYTDEAAAGSGNLSSNRMYKSLDGIIRIKL